MSLVPRSLSLSPCPHPLAPSPIVSPCPLSPCPLSPQIRLLRGPLAFGAVGLGTRLGDEDSLGSSDEELPPFALTHGDIGDLGDLGDMGDSSDSETEGAPTAP